MGRPPILCWTTSSSGILLSSAEPFAGIPRSGRCGLWRISTERADRTKRERVRGAASGKCQGRPCFRGGYGTGQGEEPVGGWGESAGGGQG